MIDDTFRKYLPGYTVWLIRFYSKLRLTPNHLTAIAFGMACLAAVLILRGAFTTAVLVWWLGRLLDGTDGIYARHTHQKSLFGAFFDILSDMASYSLIVLALSQTFPALSFAWNIILFFYVLCITGALAQGSLQAKAKLPPRDNRGLRLGAGLAEGGETGIAYTVFLLFPKYISVTVWIWIALLAVTVLSRTFLAYRELGTASSLPFPATSGLDLPPLLRSGTNHNPDI